MAQLDYITYIDQFFLISVTFILFLLGSISLFIVPFIQIMKMRRLIMTSRESNPRNWFDGFECAEGFKTQFF